MSQTVKGAVEKHRGEDQPSAIEQIEKRVKAARNWFDSVAPSHIDASQHVSLCMGALRRDHLLLRAAAESPESFMAAASECARLGLVPGDTYHFVAFRNKKRNPDTGQEYYAHEITGIVDYRGEIDLMYRAGGIQSVHCHVVRANDTFIWRPGQMEVPLHRIYRSGDSEQEGLASEDERGHLTGVYAYAVMSSGGYSQPVVMGASTVKKHRDAAKTDKFWGPAWPDEGPWTEDMWRKTALHKLFDIVPHSTEYIRERLRVLAEIEKHPEPRPALTTPTATGLLASGQDDTRPAIGPTTDSLGGRQPTERDDMRQRIDEILESAGVSARKQRGKVNRWDVLSAILNRATEGTEFSDEDLGACQRELIRMADEAEAREIPAAEVMAEFAAMRREPAS